MSKKITRRALFEKTLPAMVGTASAGALLGAQGHSQIAVPKPPPSPGVFVPPVDVPPMYMSGKKIRPAIQLPPRKWERDKIDSVMLTAAIETGVTLYNSLKAGTQTAPELQDEALMLGIMIRHLHQLGFHQATQKAILSVSSDQLMEDLRNADVGTLADALKQAGANITVLDMQVYSSQIADRVKQYLPALAHAEIPKITDSMIHILKKAAEKSPASLTDTPFSPRVRLEQVIIAPCEAVGTDLDIAGLYFGIAALAASTLAIGVGIAIVGLLFAGAGVLHELRGC